MERWRGKAGADEVWRESVTIADTSVMGDSPYAIRSRQGATVVPRCLFFVNETDSTTIIQAGNTITTNPRRGSNDKKPWRILDLTLITNHTVEKDHVFDVHLGETIIPYATLDPLKAILPLKRNDTVLPGNAHGMGGVDLGALGQRMRDRWQTVSRLWEENQATANQLNLLGRLDYHKELSVQLGWMDNPGDRPVRIVYTQGGEPTGTLLEDGGAIVESRLYWVTCSDTKEAYFLLAIINSDALAAGVNKYTTANWAGKTRDLHKHLWKLPIPEFNPTKPLHNTIAQAGQAAAEGAANQLARLREERGPKLTVTIARRELRAWLRASPEGHAVEKVVGRLLQGG